MLPARGTRWVPNGIERLLLQGLLQQSGPFSDTVAEGTPKPLQERVFKILFSHPFLTGCKPAHASDCCSPGDCQAPIVPKPSIRYIPELNHRDRVVGSAASLRDALSGYGPWVLYPSDGGDKIGRCGSSKERLGRCGPEPGGVGSRRTPPDLPTASVTAHGPIPYRLPPTIEKRMDR